MKTYYSCIFQRSDHVRALLAAGRRQRTRSSVTLSLAEALHKPGNSFINHCITTSPVLLFPGRILDTPSVALFCELFTMDTLVARYTSSPFDREAFSEEDQQNFTQSIPSLSLKFALPPVPRVC